jgi:hypothetical protein
MVSVVVTSNNTHKHRYTGAKKWQPGSKYDVQSNYDIKLTKVQCTRGEWGSCTYSEDTGDCYHWKDVFLSCHGKVLHTYIVNNLCVNIDLRNANAKQARLNSMISLNKIVVDSASYIPYSVDKNGYCIFNGR